MIRNLLFIVLSMISVMAVGQNKIRLVVDETSMTATLADNEAARELLSMLENGPVSINMSDYGGFEKVGPLPRYLPASDTQITTRPGDIMLYQGRNLVIFYGSNTWAYTPIGSIDGATAENVRQFLGSGDISLTICADQTSGIGTIHESPARDPEKESFPTDHVYDLNGNLINSSPLPPGIYIVNGKKITIGR